MLIRENLTRDDFWNAGMVDVGEEMYPNGERIPLVAATHVSPERYDRSATRPEIVPLAHPSDERQYVMAHFFRALPIRKWADSEATRLVTVGERLEKCGDAQAWYYPDDRLLVMWEVLAFRSHPRELDKPQVADLWRRLEGWLLQRFPDVERIATEGGDPAWELGVGSNTHRSSGCPEDGYWYQAILQRQGYAPADNKPRGGWVTWVERERPHGRER